MADKNDELPEILDTYTDTWGKMVRLLILKKFTNGQRYYISIVHDRNIAFFKIRKKKIRLVLMLSEENVRNIVQSHEVVQLSDSV